jgi:hypothetical protein
MGSESFFDNVVSFAPQFAACKTSTNNISNKFKYLAAKYMPGDNCKQL